MSISVQISEDLYTHAKLTATASTRSINEQVDHWGQIGRTAEAFPEMPYQEIQGLLQGIEEFKAGKVYPLDLNELGQ